LHSKRKLEKYIEINKTVNRYKINCYILFHNKETSLRQIMCDSRPLIRQKKKLFR